MLLVWLLQDRIGKIALRIINQSHFNLKVFFNEPSMIVVIVCNEYILVKLNLLEDTRMDPTPLKDQPQLE